MANTESGHLVYCVLEDMMQSCEQQIAECSEILDTLDRQSDHREVITRQPDHREVISRQPDHSEVITRQPDDREGITRQSDHHEGIVAKECANCQCTAASREDSRRSTDVKDGCCGHEHLYDSATLFTNGVQRIDSLHAPYLDSRTTDIPTLAVAIHPSSNKSCLLVNGAPFAIDNEGNCKEQLTINSDIMSVNVHSDGGPFKTPPHTGLVSAGSRGCRQTQCHGQRSESAIELVRNRKFDRSSKCLLPLFIFVAIVNPLVLPILVLYYIRSLHHWRRGQVTRALWCLNRATLAALVGMLLSTCAVGIGAFIYLSPYHTGSDSGIATRTPDMTVIKNTILEKFERQVSSSVPETEGSPTAVRYDAVDLHRNGNVTITTTVVAQLSALFDSMEKNKTVYTHKSYRYNDTSLIHCNPDCKEIHLASG
ncbi:uncharacterized protein LOC127845843 [Dreissena polymorpha]|uniref:Uncharacterized protein n=1 Tax=Dreissena polymorpha TaxID=45954 RepID=A0A9D4E6D6_DREPO|nr:uncharacterized protein LOC127845843 [Dreissena polymorpha]KAH3773290.1 hypothetical protein DPMN_174649 [Dreissena polymorpha]